MMHAEGKDVIQTVAPERSNQRECDHMIVFGRGLAERRLGLANGAKAPLRRIGVAPSNLPARSGPSCAAFAVAARVRHLVTIGWTCGRAAELPMR